MKSCYPMCVGATFVMILLGAPISAQNSPIPRTADGKPDLTGVYQAGSTRRGNWAEANDGDGFQGKVLGSGTVERARQRQDPPPYQPWAAKKVAEYVERRSVDDPDTHCLPTGVPRITFYGSNIFPMQIVQTPKAIVILNEYQRQFRYVPLNAKHRDDIGPTFMGDSVGHWEGDTLVVDVNQFNDRTWLNGTGTFHSEALHVVERYTKVDKDRINYEAIVEDPKVFTQPWHLHQTMMLRADTLLTEYVCEENNLDAGRIEKIEKEDPHFTNKK